MTTPYVGWDFSMISASGRKGCFILRCKANGLELKGGIYLTQMPDGTPGLLFLGSPRLGSVEDLKSLDMFIVDIPTHEMAGDLVVMTERRRADEEMAERLKVTSVGHSA